MQRQKTMLVQSPFYHLSMILPRIGTVVEQRKLSENFSRFLPTKNVYFRLQ